MAATASSMPAPMRPIGTLAVSNSWGSQPWPTPAITRPPLNWSRVAKRRASTTGGWSRAPITAAHRWSTLVKIVCAKCAPHHRAMSCGPEVFRLPLCGEIAS